MHDTFDPQSLDYKTMAKRLREALADRGTALSHAACLEIVARQFGAADWNVLAARGPAPRADEPMMPPGWFKTAKTNARLYRMGTDPAEPGTALIESRPAQDCRGETAVFMQTVSAESFRGQRLRLRAELETRQVPGGAPCVGTLWMRIDRRPGDTLVFDNMMSREKDGALHGTAGWCRRQIVLDVAADAATLNFGFFLQGSGRLRVRALTVVPARADEPSTNAWGQHRPAPMNLEFRAA